MTEKVKSENSQHGKSEGYQNRRLRLLLVALGTKVMVELPRTLQTLPRAV